jgi:TM2 domain-containing membrane protein YozV
MSQLSKNSRLLVLLYLLITLCSWSVKYPDEVSILNERIVNQNKAFDKSFKNYPPFDYGDRTQFSAFILCVFLGFTGLHHFYMRNYGTGITQLCLLLCSFLFLIIGFRILIAIGLLMFLSLAIWLIIDLIKILFKKIKLKNGRSLIPW